MKRFIVLAGVFLLVLATVAQARNIREEMDFWGDSSFQNKLVLEGLADFNEGVQFKVYRYAPTGGGTLNATVSMGNYFIVDESTGNASVGLPPITQENIGALAVVKKADGNTTAGCAVKVASYAGQYIEATRGTYSGTSDTTNDAAGDVKAWIASQNATHFIWHQLWANQS